MKSSLGKRIKALRKKLFRKTEDNFFRPRNRFITVGRHTYGIRKNTIIGATEKSPVSIGHFCSIGGNVQILAHVGHPVDLPSTYPFRSLVFRHTKNQTPAPGHLNHDSVTRGPIHIGHDVWVGHNALILSGVTIGIGAVIGAGAVVTRDIPPYAIAVGSPARVIRHRFDTAAISALLKSEWWELPDAALEKIDSCLYARDIPAFLDAVVRQRANPGGQ
jgi:acetyltransferase-like isoleucine patch superfamily enzyme